MNKRAERSIKGAIRRILKENDFEAVVYCGPIRIAGTKRILFYDADFIDADTKEFFSYREFMYDTDIRKDMLLIIKLFFTLDVPEGYKVKV